MPRIRLKHNLGLPARWTLEHGAYFYYVPKGQECHWDNKKKFRLGKKLSEAHKEYGKRIGHIGDAKTIGDLLSRYELEVIPDKNIQHQRNQLRFVTRLRKVFGKSPINSVRPQDAYIYVDKSKTKGQAIREIKLLVHAFTKATQWGYIDRNPLKGELRFDREKPRTRYVEDWEVQEALSMPIGQAGDSILMLRAYIKLKLLTGLRRGDLLRLEEDNITAEGIEIKTSKTGKPIIYEWTDELRYAVAEAKAARPLDISRFIFCKRDGKSYQDETGGNSFNSIWQRFMKRLLVETNIKVRFTEHDLRAKVASDAENLERARMLLGHENSATTNKIYRRRAEKVRPTK